MRSFGLIFSKPLQPINISGWLQKHRDSKFILSSHQKNKERNNQLGSVSTASDRELSEDSVVQTETMTLMRCNQLNDSNSNLCPLTSNHKSGPQWW